MFCKVLVNNLHLCKALLELLLDVKIKDIIDVTKQKSIDITADAKSVRLDVYIEDEEESVYDVEMQTTVKKELPKRSRYYQGMIDLNLIEKGSKYKEMKRSYVIFICTEDPFDRGFPVYTFENRCKEDMELLLGDETVKVFINASGDTTGLSLEMIDFLRYVKTGVVGEDAFISQIDGEVKRARKHLEWRTEYMTLQMHYDEIAEEAMERGYAEGMEKGMAEGMEKGMEKGMAEGMEKGMAEGMEKGMEKGMAEGRERGMVAGRELNLVELIKKKLYRGKAIAVIADELEETEMEILRLIKKYEL